MHIYASAPIAYRIARKDSTLIMKEFSAYTDVTVWKQKAPPVGTDGTRFKTQFQVSREQSSSADELDTGVFLLDGFGNSRLKRLLCHHSVYLIEIDKAGKGHLTVLTGVD